ncbi:MULTISPECIES: type II secretion system minor pseudopilin GspK [unclassified Rhizobacter]|uniref:type II secretion system minor pseudopilin GspK n=1 Tax=unclassified Rhizobacter TaxID=2640088 RepID=UPI0006F89EDE|nr:MULTISPECIES: type II secretion system minor pseudopilin GspK [unclassified Rhizobacter]KQU67050.1 general secretion pathway protein GspK [Rhizobacter sp. Root29]KQV98239.1 general secretion pathway protein GspK [Rhizobacter sp. Root1238]KRB02137.1 general secretion pathway protein GspK [Rhizobacter sp. Root16D2]
MTRHRTVPAFAQRGAALLMAMIIVTLIATLAVSMVWQQWRAVQVETAERSRSQSAWMLSGALDWSRIILKEDAKSGGSDNLGEPWAVPLEEARLSTFLAADKDNTDDAPEAFLSGGISDLQARFNLTNLVDGGKPSTPDVEAFRRLCERANVAVTVADNLAKGLLQATPPVPGASAPTGTANAPLLPKRFDQLVWLGVDPAALARLEPYITILPTRTPINANTASKEVLASVMNVDVGTAERLVQVRQRNPFKSPADVQAQLPATFPQLNGAQISVNTSYFEVRGRLRLTDQVLEQRSVVERRGTTVTPLSRERVSSMDSGN